MTRLFKLPYSLSYGFRSHITATPSVRTFLPRRCSSSKHVRYPAWIGRYEKGWLSGRGDVRPRADKRTTDAEWRSLLSPAQHHILREGGTEAPHSGKYNRTTEDGVYRCAGCAQPLYRSDTKFVSGCGWPSFFSALPEAIERRDDESMGMHRAEIACSGCGGHLGHVFEGEGFPTPTNERHCVNSLAIELERLEISESERIPNPVLDNLKWVGE